jgi:glutathione S-transferase
VLAWLENTVGGGGHIVDASLTAADLFFAPMIDYHRAQVGDETTFDRRPALCAWFNAVAARPSFVATKAD